MSANLKHGLAAGAVFLMALALRLFVVAAWPVQNSPRLDFDERQHFDTALSLAERGEVATPTRYGNLRSVRGPGYPLFLSLFVAGPDTSLFNVRAVQAALGAATAAAAFFLALSLFSFQSAVMAGALVALYPSLVVVAVDILPEAIFPFLVIVTTWLLTAAAGHNKRWVLSAVAGAVAGFATLTRSEFLTTIPLVILINGLLGRFGIAQPFRQRQLLVVLLFQLLVMSPWLIRNYLLHERFIMTTGLGLVLWQHNYPGAYPDDYTRFMQLGPLPQHVVAESMRHTDNEAIWNQELTRAALASIVGAPHEFLARGVKRLGYLWNVEVRHPLVAYVMAPPGFFGQNTDKILFAFLIFSGLFSLLVLVLSIAYASFGWWNSVAVIAAAITTNLSLVCFWLNAETRYRINLIPLLAVLAAGLIGKKRQGKATLGRLNRRSLLLLFLLAGLLAFNFYASNEWELISQLSRRALLAH